MFRLKSPDKNWGLNDQISCTVAIYQEMTVTLALDWRSQQVGFGSTFYLLSCTGVLKSLMFAWSLLPILRTKYQSTIELLLNSVQAFLHRLNDLRIFRLWVKGVKKTEATFPDRAEILEYAREWLNVTERVKTSFSIIVECFILATHVSQDFSFHVPSSLQCSKLKSVALTEKSFTSRFDTKKEKEQSLPLINHMNWMQSITNYPFRHPVYIRLSSNQHFEYFDTVLLFQWTWSMKYAPG